MNIQLQKPDKSELTNTTEQDISILDSLRVGMIIYRSRPSINSNPFSDIRRVIGFSHYNGYAKINYECPTDSLFKEWIDHDFYTSGEKCDFYMNVSDISEYKYEVCELDSFLGLFEEAKSAIENPSVMDKYKVNQFNDETALVGKINSAVLESINSEYLEVSKKANSLKNAVEWQMEIIRYNLKETMRAMDNKIALIMKEVEKITRVITIIKLYLGIEEELVQLKSGTTATGKVTFRQSVVFMDEEYMAWENGGLDWTQIKLFDDWLLKNENYKKIIPEEKGMVAMKPRRYKLDYEYYGRHESRSDEKRNKFMTYFLIRNGENLYRIYTDNLSLADNKLFPSRDDLLTLSELVPGEKESDDKMYAFRKQAMFMQGLFDRTEVFNPIGKVSVTNQDSIEANISYIYDADENLIGDGKVTWKQKLKQFSEIKPGDRVIFISSTDGGRSSHNLGRFVGNYSREYNAPQLPSEGLYLVHAYKPTFSLKMRESEYEKDHWKDDVENGILRLISKENYKGGVRYLYTFERKQRLVIKYNPGDVVYGSWGSYDEAHKRKNNISFIIEERDAVYQFDEITIEECYHFLHNRADRRNYISMMPALHQMIKIKKQEQEKELEFAKMIISAVGTQHSIESVMELIQWWKLKNKWKRPLSKDDEKAYRMIISKLKSRK